MQSYTLRLPDPIFEGLQNAAAAKGVPMAELARTAIEEYLVKYAREIVKEMAEDQARRQQAASKLLATFAGTGENPIVEQPSG